jgi:hypothetical protein
MNPEFPLVVRAWGRIGHQATLHGYAMGDIADPAVSISSKE